MDIRKFDEEVDNLTTGKRFIQLPVGSETKLRLVGDFHKQVIHFLTDFIDEDADVPKVALCTKDSKGECFFCDVVKKLFNSHNEEDQQKALRLKARKRYLWVAIVRNKNKEDFVGILDIGPQCFISLSEVKRDWEDFTDEKKGYDVIIKVTSEMGWNKYKAYAVAETVDENGKKSRRVIYTPLTEKEKEMIKEANINLSEIRFLANEDDIKKIKSFFNNFMYSEIEKAEVILKGGVQNEKEENVGNVSKDFSTMVKKPRCFGQLYDKNDEESCGKCAFASECIEIYNKR